MYALAPTVACLLVLWAMIPASAHDGADPLATWYKSLKTNSGNTCCDQSDCRPTPARITPDGWQVKIEGQWQDVPPEVILQRENLAGEPVACVYFHRILCFIPPAGA